MCFTFISEHICFIVVTLNDAFSCSGYMTSYAIHRMTWRKTNCRCYWRKYFWSNKSCRALARLPDGIWTPKLSAEIPVFWMWYSSC